METAVTEVTAVSISHDEDNVCLKPKRKHA